MTFGLGIEGGERRQIKKQNHPMPSEIFNDLLEILDGRNGWFCCC